MTNKKKIVLCTVGTVLFAVILCVIFLSIIVCKGESSHRDIKGTFREKEVAFSDARYLVFDDERYLLYGAGKVSRKGAFCVEKRVIFLRGEREEILAFYSEEGDVFLVEPSGVSVWERISEIPIYVNVKSDEVGGCTVP